MSIITPKDLLLPYQRRWVDDPSRFKMGIWSRQTGKDFSSEEEVVEDCHHRAKTTWLIGAPSERQALESLAKAKEWAEAYQFAISDYLEERDAPGALIKAGTITFPNGSRAIAVPGRPETVRGYSANALLTEFAFFDNPTETWRAMLPSITNPLRGGEKKVRLITTPNGKGDKTFEIWDANYINPQPERKQRWSCHRVTIHDAVRDGLPVDVEELREALDDPEGWAQEFECEFLDGSNVLLPYDLIALAESTEATEFCEPAFWASRPAHPLFMGIDFGRQHDPTVCWTLEQVGDVQRTREVLVERGMSTPDQEAMLIRRIERATRVCFDYTGPGIGLGDYLVKRFGEYDPAAHKFGKIELCTFTVALKRDIFPKLRRAFEPPTRLRVPVSVAVREDLHAMKQVIKNGEYTYSAPRTAEGHSDRCTALALAKRAAGDGKTSPGRIIPVRRAAVVGRRSRKLLGV